MAKMIQKLSRKANVIVHNGYVEIQGIEIDFDAIVKVGRNYVEFIDYDANEYSIINL